MLLLDHTVSIRQACNILFRSPRFSLLDNVRQRIGQVDMLAAAFRFAVVVGIVVADQAVMGLLAGEAFGLVIIQSFQLIAQTDKSHRRLGDTRTQIPTARLQPVRLHRATMLALQPPRIDRPFIGKPWIARVVASP